MIDTLKLRKTLGWLGMLLPWIVLLLSVVYGFGIPQSISATYYTPTCITPFMIILGSSGILLITYKGYDKQDDIVCTIAGILGICICLFPCFSNMEKVGTFNLPADASGWLHNISAIAFFGLLAYNSLCLFTKTVGEMTPNKKKRNVIFKVCGIGMIASFLVVIPLELLNIDSAIWIMEALALMFFGVSWLTKSQCYKWLFKD